MRKLLVFAAIAAGLILITLLGAHRRDSNGGTAVHVQAVAERTIRSSILASGELSYRKQALLQSELIGVVKAIHVGEGDLVQQGQLVLELNDEAYAAEVAQMEAEVRARGVAIRLAEASLQRAENQFARIHEMHESRLVSTEQFEQQTLELDVSRLELESARTQLQLTSEQLRKARDWHRKTRILAPLDGVVIAVDIKVGEVAVPSASGIPGSELVTIADPASIYAKVHVDEADIMNLGVGDAAKVVATSASDQAVEGEVVHIATSARVAPGRQGLSFEVDVGFEQPDPQVLRPGVSCRAEIFVRSREAALRALSVPIQAVQTEETPNGTSHHVFVVRNGRAHRVEVQTGASDDEYLEITTGLSADDQIITGPDALLRNLRTGDTITVSSG